MQNTVAAVAAATALGLRPEGQVDVRFSSLRGEVVELDGGVTVVNDCYNANPMSMRAALEHLAQAPAERRVAVLGTMAELGAVAEAEHRAVAALATELGIRVIALAEPRYGAEQVPDVEAAAHALGTLDARDAVLVKGSRVAGLERLADLLLG